MARNVFFTHGTRNEQFLQQNLVEEYIKMFGMDVLYIPRQMIAKDNVCLLYTSPSPRDGT